MTTPANGRQNSPRARKSLRLQGVLAFALSLFMPALLYAACTCGFSDGMFTLKTITLDGNMSDWATVLADTDNNTCDGPINGLVDRDAPVQSSGRDIVHFSFTWDAAGVYLYTERVGSASNVQRFIYYADTNNDGTQDTGEPVIGVNWQGSNRLIEVYNFNYLAINTINGDPLVDASGFADGYTLPGSFINVPKQSQPTRKGNWGSSDGRKMEFFVSWAELGVSQGAAFTFHVSSANTYFGASSITAQIDDNLSGCGGGLGGTQFAALTFTPNRVLTGEQGESVFAAHTLTNNGNGNDTFDFGSTITGAHTPAISYYLDADGSGTLTAGDTLLTDTDGDSFIDTGLLASGQTINILIAYQIGQVNAYTPSGIASIATVAQSSHSPASKTVTDTVEVILYPAPLVLKTSQTVSDPINLGVNPKAIPGAFVLYNITVTNTGGGALDLDSLFITDAIPANAQLLVADVGAPGSGPVAFTDGAVSSGLTYNFVNFLDSGDDVGFSSDGGVTYSYAPSLDGNGADGSVTHLQVNPKGIMPGTTASGSPSCQISFLVRIQ